MQTGGVRRAGVASRNGRRAASATLLILMRNDLNDAAPSVWVQRADVKPYLICLSGGTVGGDNGRYVVRTGRPYLRDEDEPDTRPIVRADTTPHNGHEDLFSSRVRTRHRKNGRTPHV